jgi:hypothetical protein
MPDWLKTTLKQLPEAKAKALFQWILSDDPEEIIEQILIVVQES